MNRLYVEVMTVATILPLEVLMAVTAYQKTMLGTPSAAAHKRDPHAQLLSELRLMLGTEALHGEIEKLLDPTRHT